MSTWTHSLGKLVKDELDRLKIGNKREQQRHENTWETISSVCLEPWKDFGDLKYAIGHYRAAKVLAQYRLFYELIDADKVVHFVWLNDDDHIHDNSKKPDPCYERFKNLAAMGKIPKYSPKPKPGKPQIKGTWKKSEHIYSSLSAGPTRADTFLFMQQQKRDSYRIQAINATEEGTGLELLLLQWVSKDANSQGVHLYYELDLKGDPQAVSHLREIFKKSGFTCTADDDMELWEK